MTDIGGNLLYQDAEKVALLTRPTRGRRDASLAQASTFLSCAFREQENDQATHPTLLRPRVARAQKLISPHPLPLLILPIELLHHLIGQIQRRLIIEYDLHRHIVSLVDDRDVPVFFPNNLRSRLHFSHVLRNHFTLFLLNLAIEVGQAALIGLHLGLELTLFLLFRTVG